jgi:8-oxo-dGTP diphosphatase
MSTPNPIPPNLTPKQKRDFYARLTPEEYFATLSTRHVGVAVILLNDAGQLLIVKPNYKDDGWLVPGGTVDDDESPRDASIRETFEEIGLTISDATFLYVEHTMKAGRPSFVEFTFLGGTLTPEQIATIKLQTAELDEFRFVDVDVALTMLRSSVARRVAAGLAVMKGGDVRYTDIVA